MTTNTNTKKNILLIDSNSNYFPSILYYIDLNKSDFIVFNSNENTYDDVIQLIRNNNNNKYESIGIFQNNSDELYYQFSKKEKQCLLENDSSLTSWNEYINFLNSLKTEFSFINLDLIVCALYSEPNEKRSFSLATLGKKSKIFLPNEPKWKFVIDELQTQLQIQISTSDNINQNGYWFFETNKGINLIDVYFINQQILEITPQISTTKKLLLIDNRIKDIELIINSMNDNTYCLVFNYFYDTYETLLSKIRFLSGSNRYILDNFFYEEPQLPVRRDSEGNHCTTCEEFSIDDLVLSPTTLESEYLNNNSVWNINDNNNKLVFFQREKKIELNSSIIYRKRPFVNITDLDAIYQIAQSSNQVTNITFECIGIIQHTVQPYLGYKLVNSIEDIAVIENIQITDADLLSWSSFSSFIQSLKTLYQITTLDLMACALYANPDWKYIIDNLSIKNNITIRASNDNTGSSNYGGNWILETNDINLTNVYFTNKIYEWQYVLATYIDNRFYGLRFNDSMAATRSYDARLKIAAGTSNFTIETWYYETAARYNCSIVDMGDYNYTFQIRNLNVSGPVGLSFTNRNFNGGSDWLYGESAVVPVAQWSHLAITRSGSTFTFYVNGIARQTFTNSASLFSNDSTFAIGWQSPDSCQCNRMKTDCVLYDIRLWNVARTASEIQMNRNRVIPANSSGLVANYLCTDNSNTFNDRTSNALHATIQSYDSARWTNSLVPIPNVGFLINNGYSLTTYNSTALNAVTHFDNITYTDFSNLNLSNVIFTNANLTGCNFTSANLSNANLNGANLTNANLTNATLDGTYLIGANLTGATTTGSTIASAITTTTLIKSNSSAFYLTPPVGATTTYGPTWSQLGSTIFGSNTDDVLNVQSISKDGTIIAVSSPGNDSTGTNRGFVKIFKWSGSSWNQLGGTFYGISNNDLINNSKLSSDGNYVAFRYNDSAVSNKGFIGIFIYDSNKTVEDTNVNSASYGPIGWSRVGGFIYNEFVGDNNNVNIYLSGVCLSGNGQIIAIGCEVNDGTSGSSTDNRGSVRVYRYDPNKLTEISDQSNANFGPVGWTRMGTDIDGESAGDNFGAMIELSTDGTVLAGTAINSDVNGTDNGQVRVFKWDTNSSTWVQRGRTIYGQLNVSWDTTYRFAYALSLSADGNIIACGNSNYASYAGITKILQWNSINNDYQIVGQQLKEFGDWQASGHSVSLSSDGQILAVGAYNVARGFTGNGIIRVYKLTTYTTTLVSPPPTNMTGYSFSDTIYRMTITGNSSTGSVWGTNLYTADSNIARAAVHAGVIANGETKEIYLKMERFQYKYFGSTRNGVTTTDFTDNSVTYLSYYFMDSPKLWVQIGNEIAGQGANYYIGGFAALSGNGTTLAVTGFWSNNIGLVQVYSLSSTDNYSHTSSASNIAEIYGDIVIPKKAGFTTIASKQSSTITTSLLAITGTAPTFSSFPSVSKFTNDSQFTLTLPESNSTGAFTLTTGTIGATVKYTRNALRFDGVNDAVVLNSYPTLDSTNQLTIEGWVFITNYSTKIICLNNNSDLGINSQGKIVFAYTIPFNWYYVVSDTSVPLNTWVYIAIVKNDNGYNKIYINNNIVRNEADTVPGTFRTCVGISLASNALGNADYCSIILSELRVWSIARTEKQIRDNYNREILSNSTGLQIYYKFNQGTSGGNNTGLTTLTDSTSNNYHGTLTNFALSGTTSNYVTGVTILSKDKYTITNETPAIATINPDVSVNALNFNGTNNYIDLVSNITEMGQGNFTIECWIKTTGTRMGIINCQDGDSTWESGEKSFYLDVSGKPAFVGFGNNFILSTQAVDDNNWHHVAVVWSYSTTTGFIYIDGKDRTNKLNNFPYQAINNNSGRFIVGVPNNSEAINYFSGSICELRIWSVARTASQIYQNFRRILNGDETGLVCYNRLNQGTANGSNSGLTTATNNMVSGGYAGSLSGFSLVSNTSNWVDGITLRPNKDVTITGVGVATITAIQEESGIYDVGTTTATVTVVLKTASPILTLDGVDDAINVGVPAWTYSTQFRTTMTVECWFKTSDTNNQKTWTTLVGRNRSGGVSSLSQFAVIMIPSGKIRFELTNTTDAQEVHTTTTSYKDGLWHHIAVTYNSVNGEKKIYIDGSISRTDTVISGFGLMSSDTTRKLVFGSDSGALDEAFTDRQFRGSLSDIRIWSVVRTASEISNNYRQRLIGNESGLLGYWKLNQGYGSGWGTYTIAIDSTSNRSHGTLTNFATPSNNWTLSTLAFLPRISDITLGSKNGLYSLSDSSFTFTDPLSNSFGNFSYAINSAVATLSTGTATTKTVYTTSGAITIPTLSLFDFPEIASLADWEINISFIVTGGAGTLRALIGDMYNEINSSRGWGIWVSATTPPKIHWSFVNNTFEPAQTLLSLNTPYILNVVKSSAGTITLTLQNVSGLYSNILSISNLVASYNFDTNGNDSSGNNNNLTNVNTVTFNTSDYKRGSGAASFSGTNYFQIANDGRFSPDNFTVAFWIKPVDSSSNMQSIASCRDGFSFRGWIIYINTSNNLEFITGSGSGWSYGSDILLNGIGTINTWVHVAFTLSKSTSTIVAYINGTQQATITRTYVNNTSYPLRIGAGGDYTPAELFLRNGTCIDDFRFYNKVLSAAEIGTIVADSSFSSVISIGSNIIGKGPVTIGGWRTNGGEIFTGTISNVNVKVPTNQRLVTLVANTNGTPATITATQDSFMDFDTGTKTASLSIGNITPTLTNFTVAAQNFGSIPFTLTAPTSNSNGAFTYTSSNTAVATISGSTVTIVSVGTTTIEATQAASGSYVSETITTTLTVNPIAPTLSNFTVAAKYFGTSPFTLTAPTTNSNGAFTYTSSNINVATISGSTVTIVGVGSSTIEATQASTTNYTTGTIVATLTVNQTAPTIGALTIPAKNYGDATFSLTAPTSNSSGTFTYTSSNTDVATIIPSNIFSINNPTLYSKLTNFPSISTLSDWEISISFVTTISGRYQALIGDRTGYNTNGWTFWLNPWGGVHITSYTEGIYWDYLNGTISANTNYIFTIKRTPLYLYIFIKNVSTGITVSSNTDYISAGKNLILTPDANVYVSLNSASEGFVGTILAINVSNSNLSSINIVSVGTSTITATQASTTNYTSGSVTGSLVVSPIAPILSNFTIPAKNYGDSAFNLTPPTSSSTTTSSISSTASVIVAPSGINSLIYGNSWIQRGNDIDGEVGDESGGEISISADGNVVAITAVFNDANGNDSGCIRIYAWNGSTWIKRGVNIDGEAADDYSGRCVSLSADGSIVAIGAFLNNGNGTDAGQVRVYVWNGTTWIQRGTDIDGENTGDQSGTSVKLSADGSVVAIGGPYNDGNGTDSGHVRIYEWNSSTWVKRGVDIDGEAINDLSGYSVGLSADGSVVAIGANYNDGNGTDAGHVRVYVWNGSIWTKRGADIDGEAVNDLSGWCISLSADGSIIAIGAPNNDGNGTDSGHVRVYAWNGSTWVKRGLDIDGEAVNDFSGRSVSLSADGSVVAIGAPFNDGNGNESGQIRIYVWNGSTWNQRGMDIDGEVANDRSGWSVSISADGSIVAIGAPRNSSVGYFSGHARIYKIPITNELSYSSSNSSVADIYGNLLLIKGINGSSTITASQTGNIINGRLDVFGTTYTFQYNSFTYTSSNTAVATISGSIVTIVSAGSSTITATQPATTNYTSGTIVATFTVNQIAPTIGTLTIPAKNLSDQPFLITDPTSNSSGSFSYTSSNTAVATIGTNSFATLSLIARYDASTTSNYTISGGNVTQWNDLTGNGYHLIPNGTGPTVSSIKSVAAFDFNSARGFTVNSVPLSSAITIFMVIKYSTNISNWGSFMHHGDRDTDWAIERNSWPNALTSHNIQFQSNNVNGPPELSTTNNVNYILIGRINGSTREFWKYSDTEALGFASGSGVSIATGNKTIYVGKSDNNEGCNSTIGEILYYNSSLSDANLNTTLVYLQNKWFNNITDKYVTIVGAGTSTITATQASTTNYTSGSVTGSLVVSSIAPTISNFTVAAKNFGDAPFSLTAPTSNSGGTFTYTSSNTAVATISGTTVTIVSAGSSTITATQAVSGNYTSGTVVATLTVNQIAPTLSNFTVAAQNFGSAPFNLVAPTSNSGGAFTYTSSNTGVATISGITVTIVGGGSSTITATQADTGTYTSGTITASLVVSPIAPTLSNFSIATKYFGQPTFTITAPTTNSNGALTYTSSNTAVATISGSTVTILSVGTSNITATQASTTNYTSGTTVTTLTINSYENANLTGLDLSNNNLTGLNLSNSTLTNITSGSIIGNPTLPTNYILINGYIIGPNVNLTNVNLSSQNLTNVNFTGVNLTGANLTSATLTGVISGSITGNPTLSANYSIINGYILGPSVNLSSKDLSNMNLLASNLTNVNLNSANIDNTDFSNTTLTGVKSSSVTGTPILPNNYYIIKGCIVGSNVDLTSATLTNINYSKVSYNAFDDFISGPTVQSTSNDWQYFEVNTDRSSSSLLSNWQNLTNSTNQVIPYGQWDNNRAFDSYPLVQKVADSGVIQCQYDASFTGPALIMCPDNSSTYNVGMGFKNTTGNTININIDLALSLLFPDRNTDGVNYFIQRGLINDARYKLYVNNSIPTASTNTFTFNKKNIELQNGEFIYLILNCVGVFFWDYIRVVFNVTINDFKNLTLSSVNLTNANLSGTNLLNVTLTNCNVTNTDFRTATLTNLISSSLTGTPLLSSNYNIVNNLIIGPSVNLTNVNLSNQNLTNINLSGTNLTGANLTNATLTGVVSGSVIGTPTLSAAYTMINGYVVGPNVNLTNATLTSQNLTNKDLSGANLTGANLTSATLTGVISGSVTGTPILSAAYNMINGYVVGPNVNLTNATLSNQNLTNKDLSGANLTGANLTGATLTGVASGSVTGTPILSAAYSVVNGYVVGPNVNLTNATLNSQNLTNKDLSGANLTGTNLTGATLTGVLSGSVTGTPTLSAAYSMVNGYVVGPNVNLTNATLTSQNLTNKDLSGANLTGANLTGATLTGIASGSVTGTPTFSASYSMVNGYVVGPSVNLTNATLSNQNLSSKDLSGATLTGANLSGITVNTSTVFTNAVFTNVVTGNITGTTNNFPTNYNIIGGYVIGPSVNLVNATLSGANLSTKNLTGVDLTGANLSGANLSNVTINSSTNFTNSTLTNVSSGSLSGTTSTFPTNYNIIGGYVIGPSVNLSNAVLSGLNLNTKILTGVNFTNANLTNVVLTGSTIDSSTNMTNATLTNVTTGSLIGTSTSFSSSYNLINGYVVGPSVNLTGANLSGQNLTNKDLSSANLTNVNLTSATLTGLKTGFITGTPTLSTNYTVVNNYILGPSVNLTNANLANQNLTNVNLSGANLSGTVLTDATLTGLVTSSITGAPTMNTSYTIINGYVVGPSVNLTNANLSGQDLTGKDLSNVNLSNANLSNATTTNIILSNTNINNADITNITFSNMQKAQLLKNTNNRSISNVQISNLSGTDILSLIPNSTISTINNISSVVFKVIPPSVENTIDLSLVTSGAFYVPSSTNESVIIDGKTYYSTSSGIINTSTGLATETLTFGTKIYKLFSGSIVGVELNLDTYKIYGVGFSNIFEAKGTLSSFSNSITAQQNLAVVGTSTLTGNVGINKSPSDTYKVDVLGTVRASLFTTTSDYRIKEDISNIEDNIDELKPVKYKNKLNNKMEYGFIAHEVQDFFPEIVEGDKDGEEYQSINYSGLIPILVNEIKKLKEEIKNLKK
jgi:uncharacterized protein YjbI with pentapeptide repeats